MGTAAPAMMRTEDLEAAIAELPAKKDALREAFDRLAACSPYPLPFTWEQLDAHVSSTHTSISRRFRQLRVLEAARPAHAGKNQEGVKEEEEEEVEEEEEDEEEEEEEDEVVEVEGEEEEGEEEEEEVVVEEVEEEEEDNEGDEEEEEEEEVEEEEVEEEEEEEVEEEEEEEVEEEADKEMQGAGGNVGDQAEGNNKIGEDVEQDANEEAVATNVYAGHYNVSEWETLEDEEEQDSEKEMAAKMTKKQLRCLPPCGWKDLIAACERMDAGTLAQFVIHVNIVVKKNLLDAMFHAPDPPALVLQVVNLFLSSKKFKCSKVWKKCVNLIRWLSMASAKASADTTEEAKLVAKDWKEMIDGQECCGELDLLSAWGLIQFLISYNIVSEFSIHEIIRLFAMVHHKSNKKHTVKLCEDLGLTDRITELIDYMIGNGQHLETFHFVQVFNLEDRYPLLSLLKGLIENVKQTAVEIFGKNKTSKSLNLATPKEVKKEVKKLWYARHLAEKEPDSSQRSAIMTEISYLLGVYAKKRRSGYPSTASTWNLQDEPKKHKQSNKKIKKAEQERREGQGSHQPAQELNQNLLIQGTQGQLHQQGNMVQVTPQQQLPTPAIPLVPNVAMIQNFGCPLFAAMPGLHSYPAQTCCPGAQGRPFTPHFRAPQYMGAPFGPFPPQPPPFCPR